MKFAIVAGFKAFVAQARENMFEAAKKTVEKRGYTVSKQPKKENK